MSLASPESEIEVVTISEAERSHIVVLLGEVFGILEKHQKLKPIELYLYAMYFMGGLAGANDVTPRDQETFRQFREGYNDYHTFIEKNRRKRERSN